MSSVNKDLVTVIGYVVMVIYALAVILAWWHLTDWDDIQKE